MSDQQPWLEFSRFVPGFDFLRNLVPGGLGAGVAEAPSMHQGGQAFQQWLAPTMDEGEVQKRIDELKVVKFWLDQNSRALEATVQALEVQKMTLATLKSMNQGAQQMAQAFSEKVKENAVFSVQTPAAVSAAVPERRTQEQVAQGQWPDESTPSGEDPMPAGMAQIQQAQAQAMQWWGALTEQFQSIAAKAMEDIGQNMAQAQVADGMGGGASAAPKREVGKQPGVKRTAVKKSAAKKTASVRKAAAKTSSPRRRPQSGGAAGSAPSR